MSAYGCDVIPRVLAYRGTTLFIGLPGVGLTAIAALASAALCGGNLFFGQQCVKTDVMLFADPFIDRHLDALKAINTAVPEALIVECSGCGDTSGTLTEKIDANFEEAHGRSKKFKAGAYVFDDISQALKPSERTSPAKIMECAEALLQWPLNRDMPMIATLAATATDVIRGNLRPLGSMFDRIINVDRLGPSGQIQVLRDRFGHPGFRVSFDLLTPQIGEDKAGNAVRGVAIDSDLTNSCSPMLPRIKRND
jgi:hypothetical protein